MEPIEAIVHSLFRGRPHPVAEQLEARGAALRLRAGELLLREGESAEQVFVLYGGSVKVFYSSPDGFEVVAKIFRPPALFGEMECLSRIPYLESVEALEPTRVLKIDRAVFVDFLETTRELALGLTYDLAARLCIAAHNERSLAFDPVETRLATMLETYVELFGLPTAEGLRIRVPLTQDELARSLGVNRRSVQRGLKDLIESGALGKDGRYLVVRDRDALSRKAQKGRLSIGYASGGRLRLEPKR